MSESKGTGDHVTLGHAASQRMVRPHVASIDALLGHPLHVLDDGFVRVVDYMGDDAAVVQAARVSYGTGTKKVQEDRGLIRYLMRHSHTTPFEMCELKLHVRVPMDVWRQWIRHRTANVNEYSTRYSVAIDAAHLTRPDQWRVQSSTNRQGSESVLAPDAGRNLSDAERKFHGIARELYEERLELGVAREQARKDLPLSTFTEAYWKVDLHNLLHFLHLRMDSHAQAEIRVYADVIGHQIVAKWVPTVWQAFLDYRRNAVHLSMLEAAVVTALAKGDDVNARKHLRDAGLLETDESGKLLSSRERVELETKLRQLGFDVPWNH